MPASRTPRKRVTTGCLPCRRRKKKCGEEKPNCRNCHRNFLTCEWPEHVTAQRGERAAQHAAPPSVDADNTSPASQPQVTLSRSSKQQESLDTGDDALNIQDVILAAASRCSPPCPSPAQTASFQGASPEYPPLPPACLQASQLSPASLDALPSASAPGRPRWIPRQLNFLQVDWPPSANQFLDYYLSMTVPRLVVYPCPSSENPFVNLLLPVALSHRLALDAVFALAAAQSLDPQSRNLYGSVLSRLRIALQAESIGSEIVVATLMLIFFETAEGHSQSHVVQHLSGLAKLLKHRRDVGRHSKLDGFAMEVLLYHVVTACVADNTALGALETIILSASGQSLTWGALTGGLPRTHCLSGLASDLFELILETMSLNQLCSISETDITDELAPPSEELLVAGLCLSTKINSWMPPPAEMSEIPLHIVGQEDVYHQLFDTALIWKQAAFVNLLLTVFRRGISPADCRISNAIEDAMILLDRLPCQITIETCLNWPLVILGSCATGEDHRNTVLKRGRSMGWLKFRNVSMAIDLVRRVWQDLDSTDEFRLLDLVHLPSFSVVLS
ncbi:hypothetical protein NW755_012316 [Fusarium falciforme]|uniref:Zn(2)-C6 fungal-type domain-containing protein n=1 Tax=Fusarium falciforme TaxID=195108 RepID=A0A9W8QWK9_9HYPO|nr:hypothetical protein NW755_012316 [Fusarium falciforme]